MHVQSWEFACFEHRGCVCMGGSLSVGVCACTRVDLHLVVSIVLCCKLCHNYIITHYNYTATNKLNHITHTCIIPYAL